ncbi:MAG: hypothetical protein C4576_15745 [Desulfobacteraceae bacterium]|nr:MAG: hypothetical protein C4576_15745 [Desulfobacteraceae bacterium]
MRYGGEIIAIVLRYRYRNKDITFFTPDEFSQQLAYMSRPKGYRIAPHVHRTVLRKVTRTQEILWVKKGAVQVDLYRPDRRHLRSLVLYGGDTILLASGGHGFQMLEDTEMVEVKQGPYAGDRDKERFTPETYDTCQ